MKYSSKSKSARSRRALATLVFAALAFSFVPGYPAAAAIANPPMNPSCGLDIALAIETAGGIDTFELDELKLAFKAFAAAFLPTTASQIAVIDLDSQATVLQTLTPDLALVNSALDALSNEEDEQHTNWQDAILKAQSVFPGSAIAPDLIILATDFNPYYTGNPGVLATDPVALADAVVAADAAKTGGTHITALGIGDEVLLANLQGISGPNVNTGATSDVLTSIFQTLETDPQQFLVDVSAYAATLVPLVSSNCPTTITVNKVIDTDGNVATTADQSAGANWQFNIGANQFLTDATGTTGAITSATGTFAITETAQAGYQQISSTCNGEIVLAQGQNATCTFYNRPLGKIIVTKDVIPNDTLASFGFAASYDADGFTLTDGQSNDSGWLTPGTYSVAETADPNYTLVATCSDGSDPSSIQLAAGETLTCTFTNTGLAGGITIVKQTSPDNSELSFSFNPSWSEENFALTDGESHNSQLEPGLYSIAETDIPEGWEIASATCTNENNNESSPDNIFLNPNGSVTCVFQNAQIDQGGSNEDNSSRQSGPPASGGGGSVVYNFGGTGSGSSTSDSTSNTNSGAVAGAQTTGDNTNAGVPTDVGAPTGVGGAGDYLAYGGGAVSGAQTSDPGTGADNLPRTGTPLNLLVWFTVIGIGILSAAYQLPVHTKLTK